METSSSGRVRDAAPRPIPRDVDAERQVLGVMLWVPRSLTRGLELLEAEDFYSERHREIFRALERLAEDGREPDSLSVGRALEEAGDKDARHYVASLADAYPTPSSLPHHAEAIRSLAFRRKIMDCASRVEAAAAEDERRAVEQAEELYRIATRTRLDGDLYTFATGTDSFEGRVMRRKAGETVMGISTGIGKLDRALTGFHDGDLIIVGGRPGMAKTVFLWQAAITAGRLGKKTFCMNLEMAYERIQERCACAVSGISYEDWRRGSFAHSDANRLMEGYHGLAKLPIYMHNPRLGRGIADLRRAVRALKPEIVFVDYLQLLAMERGVDLYTSTTLVSAELKQLAVSQNIPVVCAAQLNRDVEDRFDKRPLLSDLRQTGQIEQDADVVMMLYRDAYYYPEGEREGKNGPERVPDFHPNKIEFIARKDREGGNWATAGYFQGETMWIEDHPPTRRITA